MISQRELVGALYGAYRLARLDAGGMAYFDTSPEGAVRSFFAAVLVAPLFAVMLWLNYPVVAEGIDPTRYAFAEGIGYVVSWVAFPLVMAALTQMIGRGERFLPFLVAYNWCAVLQNGVLLTVGVLATGGVIGAEAGLFFSLIALGAVLVYAWFVVRVGLSVPPMTAVTIVILDVALGVFINAVTEYLYRPLPPVS